VGPFTPEIFRQAFASVFISSAAVTALTLLWSIAHAALEISGSATCPSPEQVEAEIARRSEAQANSGSSAPPGPPAPPRLLDQSAVLDEEEADDPAQRRLRLRLFDADGKMLGERTLPADAHCKAMAATVATLLLSFELDLGEAPPKDAPEPALFPSAPPPGRRSLAVEAGAGGFASLTSDGEAAFAFLALASIAIEGSPFKPELEAQIESARQLVIGAGLARWERLWVAPGLQYRFLRRPEIWASAHFDVPMGAAIATGSNLTPNRSGGLFDLGVSGGIRVGLGPASLSRTTARSGFVPWAGLWIIGWPLRRELFLSNAPNQARLPPLEMLLGLGLSWSGM
jgi:hypothetical protein